MENPVLWSFYPNKSVARARARVSRFDEKFALLARPRGRLYNYELGILHAAEGSKFIKLVISNMSIVSLETMFILCFQSVGSLKY